MLSKHTTQHINLELQIIQDKVNNHNHTDWGYEIILANTVIASGKPNRYGCRIPIKPRWNLETMEMWLRDYNDKVII